MAEFENETETALALTFTLSFMAKACQEVPSLTPP